jgi:hypothetical protein
MQAVQTKLVPLMGAHLRLCFMQAASRLTASANSAGGTAVAAASIAGNQQHQQQVMVTPAACSVVFVLCLILVVGTQQVWSTQKTFGSMRIAKTMSITQQD